MPANLYPSTADLIRISPEIWFAVAGTLLMLLDAITGEGSRRRWPVFTFGSLIVGLGFVIMANGEPGTAFSGMISVDGFTTFFRALVIVVAMLTVLISSNYFIVHTSENAEFYALILFSVAGQSIMASGNELILLFIGLEASSIASYIMAGYLRDDRRNNEAAIKYFLLGSFATAILLYGISWIFGATGTTNLSEIRRVLLDSSAAPASLWINAAAALLFVGLAFKVAAAPFQMWAPDVYQGAPAPVSAFLSAGPKAAAFAMMLRISMTAFRPLGAAWEEILWVSAIATMLIGSFAALRQTNVKRLLGYSSIANAGYVMVAVAARSEIGTAAAMFYLAVYAFMNIGAFAVVTYIARPGETRVEVSDLAGLGQRQPAVAALFTVFILSLIGVPLTGGFFGKFYIFKAALDSKLVWLTVVGLLSAAVAGYYYLRLLVAVYMKQPDAASEALSKPSLGVQAALWGAAAAVLFLGIAPSWLLDLAGRSASLNR